MNFPWVFWFAEDELFDFFKLMDSEDTPVVFSMSSGLFSEAGRDTTILDWETGFFNPFTSVHGWDWLFRSSNQVSIVAFLSSLFLFATFNFVKIFLKVAQLTGFLHNFLLHEVWGLDQIISFLHQEMHSEVDKGVVKKDTIAFQEISPVTCNLLTSFGIIATEGFQDFMVIEAASFIGNFDIWNLAPCFNNDVVIFVVVDWDRVVDNVTDFVDFSVNFIEELSFSDLSLLLFFFIFSFNFELLFTLVFLVGFLFVFDDILIIIPLFFERVEIEPGWVNKRRYYFFSIGDPSRWWDRQFWGLCIYVRGTFWWWLDRSPCLLWTNWCQGLAFGYDIFNYKRNDLWFKKMDLLVMASVKSDLSDFD